MSTLLLKVLLLLPYLVCLSLLLRFLELVGDAGLMASQIVDPVSLGVRKLKYLLDMRGVQYDKIIEKSELSQLVEQTGDVMEGKLLEAEEDAELENKTTVFGGSGHFLEEVEDKKDSVWLIQITPAGSKRTFPEDTWKNIRKKVSHYGIRTGIFNCKVSPTFCHRKQWLKTSLLLAMPEGETYKDHIKMTQLYKFSQSHILDWLNTHLRSKVRLFTTINGVQNWINITKSTQNHSAIYVAYFSNLDETPIRVPTFFSSLSIKFTGRMKFAFVTTHEKELFITKDSQKVNINVPSIIISTPEGVLQYGIHPGEFLSYDQLVLYLKTLSPDANDSIVWSFFIINLICVFEFFITQGVILKRWFYLIWTMIKLNCFVLVFWLPFLGLFQLSAFTSRIVRWFLVTDFMVYIRSDVLSYSNSTGFLLITFLTYCCIVGFISKYHKQPGVDSQETNTAWFNGVIDQCYQILVRPTPVAAQQRRVNRTPMEQSFELLIQQLATPSFWLRPLIPTDYISHLPTWKFSSSQKDVDDQEDEVKASGNDDLRTRKILVDGESTTKTTNSIIPPSASILGDEIDEQLNSHSKNVPLLQGRSHSLHSSSNRNENMRPENYIHSSECAICLGNYCDGEVVCCLPCGHGFHHGCIVQWLVAEKAGLLRWGNHNCPNCRKPAYTINVNKLLKTN